MMQGLISLVLIGRDAACRVFPPPQCSAIAGGHELQGWTEDFHNLLLRAYRRTARVSLCETALYRMNIDDSRLPQSALHNFRITRLWTACTPLIRKNLYPHKFD